MATSSPCAATRSPNVAVLEHVDAVIKGGQLVKGPAPRSELSDRQ